MTTIVKDTIYALSSGNPPCAVSIVRVSGLCGERPIVPRRATLRAIRHPTTDEHLDDALVLYFPGMSRVLYAANNSFTGEDVLELQVHGSPAVVRDVLLALAHVPLAPLRPALPGEFTRRAFEHGRMDLNSCEALDALLRAETSTQRRLALQTGGGRQAQLYASIRKELLEAMVRVEAMLDFSDEDEIDDALWRPVCASVESLRARIRREIPQGKHSYLDAVLHGTRLVLYGRPNAGKSMLLNRLVRREAAIVSSEPGTTRDVVQVALELHGFRVLLTDTAGLREATGEIERIGITRTRTHVTEADLAILVCDAPDVCEMLGGVPPAGAWHIPKEALEQLGMLPTDAEVLVFMNKMDLVDAPPPADQGVPCTIWHGSALEDRGIDTLLAGLGELLQARHEAEMGEPPLVTEARHLHLLRHVLEALDTFATTFIEAPQPDLTLAAEELRHAAYLIGQITGETLAADEVLGGIFSRFCIGK